MKTTNMKILWITSDIFNSLTSVIKGDFTTGRPWIEPLFENMSKLKWIDIATLTPVRNGKNQKIMAGENIHYTIKIGKNGLTSSFNSGLANKYIDAINNFNPDLIHIHGTEINFGLIRKYLSNKIPIVCSVQGIIPPCHDFLKQSVANVEYRKHKSIKNKLGRGGVDGALRKWEKYIPVEKEIYKINRYFIGRTKWDEAYVKTYNPDAYYFHGEEILRPEFYSSTWNIETCQQHRVFISSSAYPLKGFHVLLKAAALLKSKYPDLKIVSPLASLRDDRNKLMDYLISEDYSNYLKSEIKKFGIKQNIELKQKLSANDMSREFEKAHVFVLPSFLENSPNSLGEAMLAGTPSVVSPVGGVLSIIKDEESALVFPADDYVMMAYQIDRIFSDSDLAQKLSSNARAIAQNRHNIEDTVSRYVRIYLSVIETHKRTQVIQQQQS